MNKRNKIIYWIATIWLALGMASTGVVQLLNMTEEVAFIVNLGFPLYFITILGAWKLLGTAAILIPGFPLVKEWAYAGFFFMMLSAALSHLAAGSLLRDILPCLLLLVLTITSWHFRPAKRKLIPTTGMND